MKALSEGPVTYPYEKWCKCLYPNTKTTPGWCLTCGQKVNFFGDKG